MSAADRPNDAGPQPTLEGGNNDGISRRAALRRLAIASGTVVTIGAGGTEVAPQFSPIGRVRAATLVPIGNFGGGQAIRYLVGSASFLGDDRDYSGYTGADALHQEIVVGATEMKSADERVMTAIENNIEHSENVALAKGKAAIIKEMNAGNSESAAQTAMEEAINSYYATIQENLLTHWESQRKQVGHHFEQVANHENMSAEGSNSIFGALIDSSIQAPDSGGSSNGTAVYDMFDQSGMPNESVELYDGTVFEYGAQTGMYNHWYPVKPDGYDGSNARAIDPCVVPEGQDAGSASASNVTEYVQQARYQNAWNTVQSKRDNVVANLSGFVSDVYSQYEPGDIPTEDLVDPITAATELSQNYDHMSTQSAHATMLGIPTTAELSATIEVADPDSGPTEIDADIFTTHVPRADLAGSASISSGVLTLEQEPVTGVTYDLTTTDGESVAIAASDFTDNGDGTWEYDASGDLSTTSTSVETLLGEEVGFESGETYDPSTWDAPLYIAYNYVDENTGEERGAFVQLEDEFTILSVTNSDGEEVKNFQPESRNSQTADVSALEQELQQLREEQIRMQEEAQEQDDSGWGLPSFGGLNNFDGGEIAGLAIIGVIVMGVVSFATNFVPFVGE